MYQKTYDYPILRITKSDLGYRFFFNKPAIVKYFPDNTVLPHFIAGKVSLDRPSVFCNKSTRLHKGSFTSGKIELLQSQVGEHRICLDEKGKLFLEKLNQNNES